MERTSIRKDSAGVSKLLIIVVAIVIIVAAVGAVAYFLAKENTAEISYKISGVVVDDSDVFIYFDDEEIHKYEVKASKEFTFSGTLLYGVPKGETRDVTIFTKVVDKDGNIVQTLSETISVSGNEKYQVELIFPSTTLNTKLTVDLMSDVTISVSLHGGSTFGTHEVVAGSNEVFTDTIIVVPEDGVTTVLVKVSVKFSDGNVKHTEKNVNLVPNDEIEVAFLVNNSTLTT